MVRLQETQVYLGFLLVAYFVHFLKGVSMSLDQLISSFSHNINCSDIEEISKINDRAVNLYGLTPEGRNTVVQNMIAHDLEGEQF